jgi:hypothetical protein
MKNKVDLQERLRKLLQGEEIRLYVTKSSVDELTAVGEKAASALEYARACCTIIEDGNIPGETPAEKLTDFLSKMPRPRHGRSPHLLQGPLPPWHLIKSIISWHLKTKSFGQLSLTQWRAFL